MEARIQKTEQILKELIFRTQKLMSKKRYEGALSCIRAYASHAYQYNQFYTNDEIENLIHLYEKKLVPSQLKSRCCDRKKVLFYDGFGLDTRGLILIYLNALVEMGYEVIYVTVEDALNSQIEVPNVLAQGKSRCYYLQRRDSIVHRINSIIEIFEKERPVNAFFYTTPDDVEAAVVFGHYVGIVTRFQINLTDHTFWIGKNAFDYCVEFRDYGASISFYNRGIPKEKIKRIPFYPWIDKNLPFAGFPFEAGDQEANIIIFSGGTLYKTIDKEMTYYKMVRKVLKNNDKTLFLYAGSRDRRELEWLSKTYPGRVYCIEERKDLYQLMKHVQIYLSTFPVAGGLMAQYAAAAGVPPLTLINHGSEDAKGILMDDENLGIYFENMESLISEVDKLISDKDYYEKKRTKVQQSLISCSDFNVALNDLLLNHRTPYKVSYHNVDTCRFRQTYIERISDQNIEDAIASRRTLPLLWYYPKIYMRKVFRLLYNNLKSRMFVDSK